MPLTFLTGGVRSGKSDLAVRLATDSGAPVVFVATAVAFDEDMAARIARHREDRPSTWRVVEEPRDIVKPLREAAPGDCVVLDCLTVWVATLMHEQVPGGDIESRARAAAEVAAARPGHTIVVSNEVGSGVHPVEELGRVYTDILGRVNVIWSRAADSASLVVAGRELRLE